MDKAILSGDFSSFKHIKTRKVFVIEVEFPEEMGRQVLEVLGMPIGGESKPVAVALLDKSVVSKKENTQQIEGEKLRTRAVLLCKDEQFQYFTTSLLNDSSRRAYDYLMTKPEDVAKEVLCTRCEISSRSELATNIDAQIRFKKLLADFDAWKVSQQYADNLSKL